MSKGAIRLANLMKESVAEIDKILDFYVRFPEVENPEKITKDHNIILKKMQKIYDILQDFSKVRWDQKNVPENDRIGHPDSSKLDVVGDQIFIETCRLSKKYINNNMVSDALKNLFMKALIDGKEIPKMTNKVIEVIHVYPYDFPLDAIRDNDNYSYKSLINTICFYTKGSDRGDKCWLVLGTEIAPDDSAGTRIRVYPKPKESALNWGAGA